MTASFVHPSAQTGHGALQHSLSHSRRDARPVRASRTPGLRHQDPPRRAPRRRRPAQGPQAMTSSSALRLALRGALLCWCLGVAVSAPEPRGRLLRVPKVYNALITSDEPLLPSRTEQATVGQVLYYPPRHATYPASSGPLVLPQVAAQVPPLFDPSQPGAPPQPLVSLPQPGVAAGADGPALELSLQGAGPQGALGPGLERGQESGLEPGLGPHAEQQQVTPWPVVYASDVQGQHDNGVPEQGVVERQPFPAANAVQTVERVDHPGQYEPPPAVDIDSVKNNRPTGIPDVPPPPLPVSRGRKAPRQQPPPPGLLPF